MHVSTVVQCIAEFVDWTLVMSRSIRDCFHLKDGVPDPRGSLSSQLPSQAIALANNEVESAQGDRQEQKMPAGEIQQVR